MHREDTESGGRSDHAFEDPFQELERMFGGRKAEELTEASGSPAETGVSGVSEPPPETAAIEPEAIKPPAWSGLLEATSPEPSPESPEAEVDAVQPPPGPDLEALVAAVDAATPAASLQGLAASPAEPPAAGPSQRGGSSQRHIVFSVAGTRYGLAMGSVVEVGPVPPVTPLPQVPAWLLGVSNLRGDILAVLDLRLFFGHTAPSSARRDRMLVLQTGRSQLTAGLVVDQVHGAGTIDPAAIRPPTAPVEGPVQQFLRGVAEHGERLLAILDPEKLLSGGELRPFAGDPQISDPGTQTPSRTEATGAAGPSPIQ